MVLFILDPYGIILPALVRQIADNKKVQEYNISLAFSLSDLFAVEDLA